jgi:hypothetical protein
LRERKKTAPRRNEAGCTGQTDAPPLINIKEAPNFKAVTFVVAPGGVGFCLRQCVFIHEFSKILKNFLDFYNIFVIFNDLSASTAADVMAPLECWLLPWRGTTPMSPPPAYGR